MFAVIRTGGKQYRVAPDDVIEVERLAGDAGDIVEFGDVLMLGGDKPQLGAPLIKGALVAAEVLEQKRAGKIIVFKKKRRKNYRRKRGHRQLLTAVRITEILTDGQKPSKTKAEPRRAAPAKTQAKPAPAKDKPEGKVAAKSPAKAPDKAKTKAATPVKKTAAKKAAAQKPAKSKTKK